MFGMDSMDSVGGRFWDSTASKQAIEDLRNENAARIAAKDAEMEVERKKKYEEMETMRNQMAELAKSPITKVKLFICALNSKLLKVTKLFPKDRVIKFML